MAEGNKPFVVTDRRKFTMDGEVRPDADRPAVEAPREAEVVVAPVAERAAETSAPSTLFQVADEPRESGLADVGGESFSEAPQGELPPAPTPEQTKMARTAYEQTTERLDTMLRATNPGSEQARPMNFEQMVNSFYMTAILQLGGATQEGQQPQVDILGARQSIDILAVLADKTAGNVSAAESQLLESALFDARMAFLEVTQAIARSAAAKQGMAGAGPSIVR